MTREMFLHLLDLKYVVVNDGKVRLTMVGRARRNRLRAETVT